MTTYKKKWWVSLVRKCQKKIFLIKKLKNIYIAKGYDPDIFFANSSKVHIYCV